MLSNYFKIAMRSLLSHKLYSSINILGLAVGLACCIMMSLFVNYELSYDTQYSNADRIARIHMSMDSTAGTDRWPRTGAGWKELLESTYTDIKRVGRIYTANTQMKIGELSISDSISYIDPEVLDIFEIEFVYGDRETALKDIHSVILTQSHAETLFGDENPMGKSILFYQSVEMKVTGVIADFEENTHLSNNSFANIQVGKELFGGENFLTNMTNMNFFTYLEFTQPSSIQKTNGLLPDLIEKNFGALLKQVNVSLRAELMSLEKLHLHSRIPGDLKDTGDINQVYLFTVIAALILLIACINFMNLATARASQRAKEVGVRKAIGVQRNQIVIQFLSESIILSGISLLIAVALVELTLPIFSDFINRDLMFDYLANPLLLLSLVVLAVTVGLLAGSYPAFYLSAFSPAKVLKGDVTRGRSGARFRQGLVIFQFSIAAFLIISTLTVYQQMQFAKNIKLGYDKEQVLILNGTMTPEVQEIYTSLENEMKGISGVKWVSSARRLPGQRLTNNTMVKVPGQEQVVMPYNGIDYDFFQNFGVELVAGRFFSRDFSGDTMVNASENNPVTEANVIINQSAARKFGWNAEEAVGKSMEFFQNSSGTRKVQVTVVGVVKDYYFESVREALKPIIHYVNQGAYYMMALKLERNNVDATVGQIESKWKQLFPTQNISYNFMDDNFNAMYADEERISIAYSVFSLLAICIACLGLFGLASYTTEKRTKEIGIRKVLGATSQSIVLLLTKEFSKLVILACVIAWPVSWYVMSSWLQNFAYRIDLSILIFLLGTLVALLIAWITVGGQATKAAIARPISALRYE